MEWNARAQLTTWYPVDSPTHPTRNPVHANEPWPDTNGDYDCEPLLSLLPPPAVLTHLLPPLSPQLTLRCIVMCHSIAWKRLCNPDWDKLLYFSNTMASIFVVWIHKFTVDLQIPTRNGLQ